MTRVRTYYFCLLSLESGHAIVERGNPWTPRIDRHAFAGFDVCDARETDFVKSRLNVRQVDDDRSSS